MSGKEALGGTFTPYSWQEAYETALHAVDSKNLVGSVQRAAVIIEQRCAEWGDRPGTPAEIKAIKKALRALRRLLRERNLR
jgi:hypothetical protein